MKKNRILIWMLCICAVTVFSACGKENIDNVLSGYEQDGNDTDNADAAKNPSNDSKGDTVPQMTVVPDAPANAVPRREPKITIFPFEIILAPGFTSPITITLCSNSNTCPERRCPL